MKNRDTGASIIGFGSYLYRCERGREGDMPVIATARKTATALCCLIGSIGGQRESLLIQQQKVHSERIS